MNVSRDAPQFRGIRSAIPRTYLTAFIIVLILMPTVTMLVLTHMSNSMYASAYFTISTLFDAVGFEIPNSIMQNAPLFSNNFNILFPLLVLDGVFKLGVIGFALAGVIYIITNIDIGEKITLFKIKRHKSKVIICGYSPMSEILVKKLNSEGISHTVIDRDVTKVENLVNSGMSAIYGNFADERVLANTSLGRAEYIIFATEKDYENLLGIITVHHLNEKIKILSRARDQQAVPKMHRAGAMLCVVPEILAGLDMGRKIVSKMV